MKRFGGLYIFHDVKHLTACPTGESFTFFFFIEQDGQKVEGPCPQSEELRGQLWPPAGPLPLPPRMLVIRPLVFILWGDMAYIIWEENNKGNRSDSLTPVQSECTIVVSASLS